MKSAKSEKRPFFAKLLESQKLANTNELKGGGDRYVTHKYPSDNDEGGPVS